MTPSNSYLTSFIWSCFPLSTISFSHQVLSFRTSRSPSEKGCRCNRGYGLCHPYQLCQFIKIPSESKNFLPLTNIVFKRKIQEKTAPFKNYFIFCSRILQFSMCLCGFKNPDKPFKLASDS